MLQQIRTRFTALSRYETNIYRRVFLRGLLRTHANKAVTDQRAKFVNKPFTTDLSVSPIEEIFVGIWKYLQMAPDQRKKNTRRIMMKIILNCSK